MTLPLVYPIVDTASLERLGLSPIDAAEALLEGGARVLQFRHKAFWSREIFARAGQIAKLCEEAGVIFVLNDRADYAAILGVSLHVGQDDLSPVDARPLIGSTAMLGFSTHNAEQVKAAEAEPVDYIAFGPVFPTGSKEYPDPTVGIIGLRTARALTTRPLVAIGGITRNNARACLEAGADSVAVIGDMLPVYASKQALRDRMAEWQRLIHR